MLERIDAQRRTKGDLGIFTGVEDKIVGRELNELEAEWRANAEMAGVPSRPNLSGGRSRRQ
jgi:hypothetical protein